MILLVIISNKILVNLPICKKGVARIQDHVLGLWDAQRDWIGLLKCKKGR